MIPVNVLSEPTLAVSEGHRPAHSRPADPTREYEPGSGASHDPAPVHRPYLARPVALAAAPAAYRCRPSGLKGASHRAGARRPCGPPLTPEASAARRQETRGQAQPAPRHRATPTARATTNSGSGTANCPPHRPGAPNQTGRSVLRGAGPARQIANRHAQPETGLRKLQRLDRPFHMNIHVPFWLAGMRSVLSWLWR